jgi:type II restriction/modification system DNA methylase subunit YeeA
MTPAAFISKWRHIELKERSAAQEHFLDLCRLVGHPTPAEADATGGTFCFEKGAAKHDGGDGYADVWKRGLFAFEYKGRHKDLNAAYTQLLQYREALENPPLLVTCDLGRIVVHTNFTATAKQVHEIPLEALGEARSLEILHALFHEPEKLRPGRTSTAVTTEAARRFTDIAASMRERQLDPGETAHFLNRIIFCLFAEDIRLLPDSLFSRLAEKSARDPARFSQLLGQLFAAMATGGDFGLETIAHFNGGLFQDARVLDLTDDEIRNVVAASKLDWAAIDPSILGTLFERGLDPAKRSQLGAHYTSREDIELLIEPVVMAPLRREWAETKSVVDSLLATGSKRPGTGSNKPPSPVVLKKARGEADRIIHRFLERLQHVTVLDPACGSGNFLYVTLQRLKDLEKEVIVHGLECGFTGFLPLVGPWQLFGIELNAFAFDLAQTSVWIGHLQWTRANGFQVPQDPVLRPMDQNFRNMDAILVRQPGQPPAEPEWPETEFIVGNPPFLGGKILRSELGDDYVNDLFTQWKSRVAAESDLCCYWFEKARAHIERGKAKRAGLLATQGIRGGANRKCLERIQQSGNIFFGIADREWFLDGANVHISMVGFDDGRETQRTLDGQTVSQIHPNLTSGGSNLTSAKVLSANLGLSFMGTTKGGAFDIGEATALEWLHEPNPHGRPNSDVIVPWINGMDVTRRPRGMWIIDFGKDLSEAEASLYAAPFEHVSQYVLPVRKENNRESYRRLWWQHVEARPAMFAALRPLPRFLVTVRVSKYRLFTWFQAPVLPDCATFAFARCDDYFFGILHSRIHEVWALAQGTQLEDRPRYTPTTCFETFPFPFAGDAAPEDSLQYVAQLRAAHYHSDQGNVVREEPPPSTPDEHRAAIAAAARDLNDQRERWLNPPEWTREEILEFPATPDGPWARFVARGSTTARWPRRVPIDSAHATKLAKRTLTNLYNERPGWLAHAHARLDSAVAAAYGWPADLTNEEILARLLERNRSATQARS